jgi:hypothetical protein
MLTSFGWPAFRHWRQDRYHSLSHAAAPLQRLFVRRAARRAAQEIEVLSRIRGAAPRTAKAAALPRPASCTSAPLGWIALIDAIFSSNTTGWPWVH